MSRQIYITRLSYKYFDTKNRGIFYEYFHSKNNEIVKFCRSFLKKLLVKSFWEIITLCILRNVVQFDLIKLFSYI